MPARIDGVDVVDRYVLDTAPYEQGITKSRELLSGLRGSIDPLISQLNLVELSAAGMGAAAMKAGIDVENAIHRMQVATGAADRELVALTSDVNELVLAGRGGLNDVVDTVSTLTQRLSVARSETKGLAADILEMSHSFGESPKSMATDFAAVAQVWEVRRNFLDKVVVAAQEAGTSAGQLLSVMKENAAVLSKMGYSPEQALALAANLEKRSISSSRVLGSFRMPLVQGISEEQVGEQIKRIQQLQESGNEREALAISRRLFKRGAVEIESAISRGAFATDDMLAKLESAGGAVEKITDRTLWDQLGDAMDAVSVAAQPFGEGLVKPLKEMLPVVSTITQNILKISGALVNNPFSKFAIEATVALAAADKILRTGFAAAGGLGAIWDSRRMPNFGGLYGRYSQEYVEARGTAAATAAKEAKTRATLASAGAENVETAAIERNIAAAAEETVAVSGATASTVASTRAATANAAALNAEAGAFRAAGAGAAVFNALMMVAAGLVVGKMAIDYAGSRKSAALEAIDAESAAMDAQAAKRRRLIDDLETESRLYRRLSDDTGKSASSQRDLGDVKKELIKHIDEINGLLGTQKLRWDGTADGMDAMIARAKEIDPDAMKRKENEARRYYLATQEEFIRSVTPGGWKDVLGGRGAAEMALHSKTKEQLLQSPEQAMPRYFTATRKQMEGYRGTKYTESEWENVLTKREEAREAYSRWQNTKRLSESGITGKKSKEDAATPESSSLLPEEALGQLKAEMAERAEKEKTAERVRQLESANMRAEASMFGELWGGVYASRMKAQADLYAAELEYQKSASEEKRKLDQELAMLERELGEKGTKPDSLLYAFRKRELASMYRDAMEEATERLKEKRITVDVELRKSSLDLFKEHLQRAYDLSILDPRFKEGYQRAATFIGGPLNAAAREEMVARGLQTISSPVDMVPSSQTAFKGHGSAKDIPVVVIKIEDSSSGLSKVSAIAKQEVGRSMTRGGAAVLKGR